MVAPIPRDELRRELQRVSSELGKSPTVREMDELGEYSIQTYYREFGSWNDALQAMDLEINHSYGLSRGELVEALTDLARELGYSPTQGDMQELGRYSPNPYYREFDSWNDALQVTGLDVHQHDATREELLAEIKRLATDRRPPGRAEMAGQGTYSPQAYYSAFGSWGAAVREAGFEPRAFEPGNRREYDYGEGWNQEKRERIRERDGRECQHCGMPAAEHRERFGENLHVHHLVPANAFEAEGYRNDARNLVALCRLHHRTWEAADDYYPLDRSLPAACLPEEVDPYVR
jgi:hypothetical protein